MEDGEMRWNVDCESVCLCDGRKRKERRACGA
jgi:hypothetical protein